MTGNRSDCSVVPAMAVLTGTDLVRACTHLETSKPCIRGAGVTEDLSAYCFAASGLLVFGLAKHGGWVAPDNYVVLYYLRQLN